MTKKANTRGGVNSLAAALTNAGVVPTTPASDETVVVPAAAPAPNADAQQQQQQQQPAPASPQAAIEAAQSLEEEIAAATAVWQHAKASGISKDQFLAFCEIDAEKFAFFKTHKKAIFGSKKQQLDEAAQAVLDANITASGGGQQTIKKPKKDKKTDWDKAACSRKEFKEIKRAHAHPDRIHYIEGRAVFI